MPKFIRILPNNIDLSQNGFNVSFTDDFNVVINGVELLPDVLLKVAQQIIAEKRKKDYHQRFDSIDDCLSNVSFYPELNGKKGGIYSIDDFYVGRSVDIRSRIKQHIWQAINNKHCNKELGRRIRLMHANKEPITVFWKECDPSDLNEGMAMFKCMELGVNLVNIDLSNLSRINKN